MELRCRGHVVSLDRTAIMGVLNVTPDSFSDGGQWLAPDRAVEHGLDMVKEGAAIIDVGGESTRPDAEPVSEKDELDRVLPVVRELSGRIDVPISIDTRKRSVALAAVEAGASIVNDTLGEEGSIADVAAETGAAIVVMHSRGTPQTMRSLVDYGELVADVRRFLSERAQELTAKGIDQASIVLDPGFGFAKSPEQNLMLLNRLEQLTDLDHPILSGTSRKSFIGAALDLPEDQRLEGTIATAVISVMKGARLVRVHDVEPVVRAIRMTELVVAETLNG